MSAAAQARLPAPAGGGLGPALSAMRARLGLAGLLFVVAAVGWWWAGDQMRGMDEGPWRGFGGFGWFLGVWVVMMAAMMFPSVSPTVALYSRMTRLRSPLSPLVPDRPGVLLRSERFERAVPDGAVAWRVLYTTTRDEREPAVASGIVVVPRNRAGRGPLPVIAWAHGTTGIDRTCAPSVIDDPFEAGALFALGDVLDRGWALVATDYVGLGTAGTHPYLVGQAEGRSVLDAVRAALALDGVDLGEHTVVWGHSQGGHAALWAGPLADRLAENTPTGPVRAPLLVGQGLDDPLVAPDVQEAYVRRRCAAGQAVDYRIYEGRDHVGVVAADSPLVPELVAWTADRFARRPARDPCDQA